MRLRLAGFAIFLVLAGNAAWGANPWVGKLQPETPGPFPMVKPFTGEFRFGWSNIDAASAQATFKRRGDRLWVDVSGGTTGLARALWQLDATHKETMLIPGLKPLSFEQVEKYAKRTTTTKGEFRPDGLWRLRQTDPGPPAKWKRIKVPFVHDMISGMLFVRSQALANGDKVTLILYPGDSPFLTDITVLGRETLKIGGKAIPAIKLDFRPQRIVKENDEYVLKPHGKFSRGTVWISDDQNRVPLRAEVDIFIGYVFGELKSITFADGTSLP